MEAELAKKKSEHEALKVRFRALEVEKVAIEDELKAFKREKEEGIVDLTTEDTDKEEEEEETVAQLMIENSVLECEKRKAENEIEFLGVRDLVTGDGLMNFWVAFLFSFYFFILFV